MTAVNLTPEYRRAVEDAARRMAAWHDKHLTSNPDSRRKYKRGGDGQKPADAEPLDAPIVRLRERGAVDGATEARLTSMAWQRSLELRGR